MASVAGGSEYDIPITESEGAGNATIGQRFVRFFEDRKALDQPAEKLSSLVRELGPRLPGGQKTVDLLNGKGFGHPLHPVLTHLPIGAFTMAMLFDMASTGRKEPSPAATKLLAIGLASVPLTALSGALDWQHTQGGKKRVGMGHLLLNSLGSSVLAASLVSRLRGRGPARSLNYLGNGILTLSAYLGGHLVFENRLGTKYESSEAAPEHFTAVMAETDLKEQTLTRVDAGGYPVLLYRRFGRVYALADTCPHLGCSLAEGSVEGDAVLCGCHGSKFALADGALLQGPSAYPVRDFVARIHEGKIEVVAL
ncbi:MAG: Rieske 2Fe-2S domain-containing protein [Dehalococcoidia bacterium]